MWTTNNRGRLVRTSHRLKMVRVARDHKCACCQEDIPQRSYAVSDNEIELWRDGSWKSTIKDVRYHLTCFDMRQSGYA